MKRFFMFTNLVLTLAIIVICFTGCQKDSKEIKIGVIVPLTGNIADYGVNALNGIKTALNIFNEKNPEIKIKLIAEDSKANPADGVSAINKLIHVDNVNIIIGDVSSGVTLAIAPIAEKNKILLFAPGSSNPKVRDAGDYIFRNWTSDDFDGKIIAKYIVDKLQKKRGVIIYINNEYGTGLANAFENTFKQNGGDVVSKEKYDQNENDFRTIISKLKGLDFDFIYLPGHPRECGLLVKQLKEFGINKLLISNLTVESEEFYNIVKDNGDGIIFSTPVFDIDAKEHVTKNFIENYENNFNSKPDVFSGHAYDAMNIILYGLKMSNYNVSYLKDNLYKIKNFEGITGLTTFDDHGDVIKPMTIKRLNKLGKSEILEVYDLNK